jgi:hypothetical protein
MAITYDITKDYLYQQGQQSMQRQMIQNMLKLEKFGLEDIAQAARVPVEYVQQIASALKK